MSIQHKNKILEWVQSTNTPHEHFTHVPVTTSEQASEIRGVSLSSGAKAIVLEGKKTRQLVLVVIPADRRIDTKAIRRVLGERVSLARDVNERIDCVPGSVPPFGSVLGLQTYADMNLADELNFNIGILTESLRMGKEDYIKLEQPIMGAFSSR